MKNTARENPVSALLVGNYEKDRMLVQEIFGTRGWRLFEARDRRGAIGCLQQNPVHVVIAEKDLPNWDWKKVLHDVRRMPEPPQLIVTSRNADDYLWAEALNIGAFDVLSQPFERDEVERVVASAHRHFGADSSATVRPVVLAPAAGAA